MMLARIENGVVVEFREISIDVVPEHKRMLWLPVEYVGDGLVQTISLEASKVVVTRCAVMEPVQQIISKRQFFQQLAVAGVITTDEALAAVGRGEIPAAMAAIIGQLPEAQRFAARMLVAGAAQFDRTHTIVAEFAGALGWSAEHLDAFWRAASQL